MIIGTNRVLQPLPVSAGEVLLDNSHGQYNDGLVMVKRLLEIYEQGQLEVTPRSIFDAQEMVTVGKEVWMDGYDLEDFEIHAAGVINELIEQVLCRMAPRGLTIDWNHDQQCLIVEEIDQ